ncbi:MAG: response regulator transcription factor [Clostridiales bacterium]|nr:response regulator transcription factor [Clostridiales bacterium]
MFKILLAEDEINLNKILTSQLKKEGYIVFSTFDGQEAYETLLQEQIDLVVTDVMMPNMDGNELTKKVREISSEIPVLMLTALEALDDKERGFNSGVDDYLTKPFALKELLLRIKALLRRYKKATEGKLVFPNTVLDYSAMSVSINGEEIPLSKKEFQILFLMLMRPNFIFSREQILQEIWGVDSESNDRTIDTHITWLRSKVHSPDFEIVTVRGLGYKAVIL